MSKIARMVSKLECVSSILTEKLPSNYRSTDVITFLQMIFENRLLGIVRYLSRDLIG